MRILPRIWQRSLIIKLNAPMVLFGIFLVLSVYWLLQYQSQKLAVNNAYKHAQLIVESIVIGAQVDGTDGNIIRLINALGAGRETDFLALIDVEKQSVIGATKNNLLGKPYEFLDESIKEIFLARHADSQVSARMNQFFNLEKNGVYCFLYRAKIFESNQVRLRDVDIVISINSRSINTALLTIIRQTKWLIIFSLITMFICFFFIQHKILLKRVNQLKTMMFHQVDTDENIVIDKKGDELDQLKSVFMAVSGRRNTVERDLKHALKAAEQSGEAKNKFLSNMSHELRTPLNSIIGFSRRLLKNTDHMNEKETKALEIIESSGNHLLKLINDILDLSKLDSGTLDLVFEEVNIADLCRESVDEYVLQAQAKGLTLSLEAEESILASVDVLRFQQMLSNLITNAIKYTHQGGVCVTAAICSDPHWLEIAVKDTGIGIREEDRQRLFKRFEQFDESSCFQVGLGSSGIGLSVIYELVHMHGGRISVTSTVDKGSCFTIVLPLRQSFIPNH